MKQCTFQISAEEREVLRALQDMSPSSIFWGMLDQYPFDRLSERQFGAFIASMQQELPGVFGTFDPDPVRFLSNVQGPMGGPIVSRAEVGDPDGYEIRRKLLRIKMGLLREEGSVNPVMHKDAFSRLVTIFIRHAALSPPIPGKAGDGLAMFQTLLELFPGRVVALPPDEPDEIIIEPGRDDPPGVAIAYIRRSVPHVHHRTTETYYVLDGAIVVYLGARPPHRLLQGKSCVVHPGVTHHAETEDGSFARIRITSNPPWTRDDHVLVKE